MLDYTKNKKVNTTPSFLVIWFRFIYSYVIRNYIKIGVAILIYLIFFKPEYTSTIISDWINNFVVKTIKDIKW